MAFPTDGQAAELVEQGDALFHDVTWFAQALDVLASALRDDRLDPSLTALGPEAGAVVALVREQNREAAAGPTDASGRSAAPRRPVPRPF